MDSKTTIVADYVVIFFIHLLYLFIFIVFIYLFNNWQIPTEATC